MKFISVLSTLAAVAEAVVTVSFTNNAVSPQAGMPFTLTWTGAVGPVTITLKNGPSGNLKTVQVLDSSDTGSTFTWTPPTTLPSDTYAFEIKDNNDPNYSVQFPFSGSASASLTSTTGSTTGTTTVGSTITTTSTATGTTTTSTTSNSSNASSTTSNTSSKSSAVSSSTSATGSKTSATTTPSNTNNGQRFLSPLALVLVTVAALLYFN